MLSSCKDVTCSLQFNHLFQEVLITASHEFLVRLKKHEMKGKKRGLANAVLIFGEYLFCPFFQLSILTLPLSR